MTPEKHAEIYDDGKRRGRPSRRRTVLKVLLASTLALVLVTGLGLVFLYRSIEGRYDPTPVKIPGARPPRVDVAGPHEPLNILVMGSDTREGAGNGIDSAEAKAGLSDVTILMHLSADRKSAYGISVPRDALVRRPDCLDDDGTTIPGAEVAPWNDAFALGGPACTIHQLEALSDVRVDNYVVVDFRGFRSMVDAVDGVEVCIPEDIDDEKRDIHLEEGTRKLYGDDALAYVRVRHIGDGTDLGRIQRQQAFIASMLARVVSGDTLSRPYRAVGFLNALVDSIQSDIANVRSMAEIAQQFNGVGTDKIQFVTVPWEFSTRDPNRVELLPRGQELWTKVRNDSPLGSFRQTAITAARTPGHPKPSSGPASPSSTGGTRTAPPVSASDDQLAAAGLCT